MFAIDIVLSLYYVITIIMESKHHRISIDDIIYTIQHIKENKTDEPIIFLLSQVKLLDSFTPDKKHSIAKKISL